MTALDIVRAAIPNADECLASAILWERTAFPAGVVNAQQLYRAASRYRRANEHGVMLCDWCDNAVRSGLCDRCKNALTRVRGVS